MSAFNVCVGDCVGVLSISVFDITSFDAEKDDKNNRYDGKYQ